MAWPLRWFGGWGWGRGGWGGGGWRWRWGWVGPWPGRGPFSYLPPWQRPGWLFGRGACWWLFGVPGWVLRWQYPAYPWYGWYAPPTWWGWWYRTWWYPPYPWTYPWW